MRLTLRTLLAYLDEILEPDDSQEIAKKIEESEFASSLMHRTRECMRRLRLGAPAVLGHGMAADPNTVAEYLDNTLPAERVPDFEKICLDEKVCPESVVYLAEVASCHQVLTLVLGAPAAVEPASRERMYRIIERPEAQPRGAENAAMTEVAKVSSHHHRGSPEVPDYLREPRSRWWAVAAVVLLAAGLTLGTLMVAGPPGVRQYLAGLLGGQPPAEEGKQNTSVAPVTEKPSPNAPDQETASLDQGKAATPPDASLPPGSKASPNGKTPESTPLATPGSVDAGPQNPTVPAQDNSPPAPVGLKFPRPTEPVKNDFESPPEPGPPVPAASAKPPVVPPQFVDAGIKSTPPIDASVPPAARPLGEEIGRYVSDQGVLVKFDSAGKTWNRLPAKAILAAKDQLVALPASRPTISLVTGVTIQPAGAAQFTLEGIDPQGIPTIAVDYGRLLLLTSGKAGNQIRVRLGDRAGVLTFSDADATAALEVRHLLAAGKNPESEKARLAFDLYATSGQVQWEEQGKATPLVAPVRKTLTPDPADENPGAEFPKWISSDALGMLDQRAAAALEHELSADRPLSLALKELSDSRRKEVRSLAIRSAAYLGQFEPFVSALNDPDQSGNWPLHIETLRTAMSWSPTVAAQVRAAIEKQRGNDAAELYRMLWGYTAEQLQQGSAATLVEYLDHDSLDYRVLAIWNLKNVTGTTHFYRPEYTADKRRSQVVRWKERLKEGKIVPITAAPAPKGPATKAKPPMETGDEL